VATSIDLLSFIILIVISNGPLKLYILNLVGDGTFSYLQIISKELVTTVIMNTVAVKDLEVL